MGVQVTRHEGGLTWTETLHEGLVVAVDSTYIGDCDSFYYAVYLDVDKGTWEKHCTGYAPDGITVDAPEHLREAYQRYVAATQALASAQRSAAHYATEIRRQEVESLTPYKGKTVRVVKGRKIAHGTEGTVLVHTESQYGGYSVKIALADGSQVWTNASNVEVIAEPVRTPVAA